MKTKKTKIIAAVLMCMISGVIMCSCDGSSSGGGSAGGSNSRDYYDTNDARNTDGHYDDGEYKEGLKNARDVWDAQTN